MQDTKEYIVVPKLAHHLLGIFLTLLIAGASAYIVMTNSTGILTRWTELPPEMVTMILWVLGVASAVASLVFIVELIVTQRRPPSRIRLTPSEFWIPMNSLLKQRTVHASYADITYMVVQLRAPNRVLRIHTSDASATVAELNVGAGVFDDIYATLSQCAPRFQKSYRKPSALG